MRLESGIPEDDKESEKTSSNTNNNQTEERNAIELKPLNSNAIQKHCPLRTGKPIVVVEKNTEALDNMENNTTKRKVHFLLFIQRKHQKRIQTFI
jgi:hypothetical protein